MKLNKVFSFMLAMVAGLVLASCQKKADPTYPTPACQAAAGEYVGQWILEEKDKPETRTAVEGCFTITATEDKNVAKVHVEIVNGDKTDVYEDVCNIIHRGENGFVFFNNSPAVFGTKFSGEIYPDHTSDMQFTNEIKGADRKKHTYFFHFYGVDYTPAN